MIPMPNAELAKALVVGLLSGFSSGLTGVSPGGGLVIFSTLLLGADQHLAQGISLIAQIPPTSLAGVRRYRRKAAHVPRPWLVLLGVGFLIFGPLGAWAAGQVTNAALRWSFVAYLGVLVAMLVAQPAHAPATRSTEDGTGRTPRMWELLAVGAIAGFSSGFLGIGGGLAVTVGMSAWLKLPQLQAQMMSLVILIIPTTLPAALVYVGQGQAPSWTIIGSMIVGLWFGADFGARLATRLDDRMLKRTVVGYVLWMAIYMGWRAVSES